MSFISKPVVVAIVMRMSDEVDRWGIVIVVVQQQQQKIKSKGKKEEITRHSNQ